MTGTIAVQSIDNSLKRGEEGEWNSVLILGKIKLTSAYEALPALAQSSLGKSDRK